MTKRNIFLSTIVGVLLYWGAPAMADEAQNLIANGSFEEYSCNIIGCQFDDWTIPLGSGTANTSDKIDGNVSLALNFSTNYTIDNAVALSDDNYAAGTYFQVKMFYKVLSLPAAGVVKSDCYWEPRPGGDADAMKSHDADVLQQTIATTVTAEWDSIIMVTSKPAQSSNLRVRVYAPKNTQILLDAFSVVQIEGPVVDEPFITVTPKTVSSVSCEIGDSANFQTIHLTQGNLTGATMFYIGGNDREHFALSASELPADQSELDIVVTYKPTQAGTHTASLIFDNANHTTILPDMIALHATCTDPTAVPSITVTPAVIPSFEAVVGKQHKQSIKVKSENCTNFINMRVEHLTGSAFTIDGTMLPKNYESDVEITFTPGNADEYLSTLTIYSPVSDFAPVVLTLSGTGVAATPETVDWSTDFQWDESAPLTLLNETFDNVEHNQTLHIAGWQNVANAEERPWWGFDEAETTPARGIGRYAKATAYQYMHDSTGIWEMWLVTPALDYQQAAGKIFAFSVMGEYMPEENNPATLELVYIDATDPAHVFFQAFEGLSIPQTSDENNVWVPFQIHLENQPNIDIFHMAFRFTSPNGNAGGVTYYIDDVSWGRTDLPDIDTEGIGLVDGGSSREARKFFRNGLLLIERGGRTYTATGLEVR